MAHVAVHVGYASKGRHDHERRPGPEAFAAVLSAVLAIGVLVLF